MAKKNFAGLPQWGSRNAIWERPKLKIELLGKKFKVPNGRKKFFAGLPQGGSQNAILERPLLKIDLLGKKFLVRNGR